MVIARHWTNRRAKSSINFYFNKHYAIEHWFLSSTSVFQIQHLFRLTQRYCLAMASASTFRGMQSRNTYKNYSDNLIQHTYLI
jgi:hypothetical protein